MGSKAWTQVAQTCSRLASYREMWGLRILNQIHFRILFLEGLRVGISFKKLYKWRAEEHQNTRKCGYYGDDSQTQGYYDDAGNWISTAQEGSGAPEYECGYYGDRS